MPGYVSVTGFCHAGCYLTGLDTSAVRDVVAPVVGAVFLATGQFSDGGHGRTVGFSERSIVSYSVVDPKTNKEKTSIESTAERLLRRTR